MKKNKINGKPLPKTILPDVTHKKYREQLFGVPPESVPISLFSKYCDTFIVHKSAKKGQSSFRITKDLLESLISTSLKIQKQPKLIISIMDGSDEYIINCTITKNKVS